MKALIKISSRLALVVLLGVFMAACEKEDWNPATEDGADGPELRTYQQDYLGGTTSGQNMNGNGDPNPGGGGGDDGIKDGDDTEEDDDDDNIRDGDDTEQDDDQDGSNRVIQGGNNIDPTGLY